jgi:lipoate-protein ligase A
LETPAEPHISIGLNQDPGRDVDRGFCRRRGLPIVRRQLGGGAVYIDREQLFFQFIVPARGLPQRPMRLFERFAAAVTGTYAAFGIDSIYRPPGDIAVSGRKLGAIAGGAVGEAMVVIGSFLFGFDYEAMAGALPAASESDRQRLRARLEDSLVTVARLLPTPPAMSEVKRRFIAEAASLLGSVAEPSALSPAEERAVESAAAELLLAEISNPAPN